MDRQTQDMREYEQGLCDIPVEDEILLHYRHIMREKMRKFRIVNEKKSIGEK